MANPSAVGKATEKSRREKRKEARQEKKQKKHQSWVQHQDFQKNRRNEQKKKAIGGSLPKHVNKSKNVFSESVKVVVDGRQDGSRFRRNESENKADEPMKLAVKSEILRDSRANEGKKVEGKKKGLKRKSKTGFEEYLEMEMKDGGGLAEEDLEIERRLAKKLKLKGGKLRGMDDELSELLEGITSVLDSLDEVTPDAEELLIKRNEGHTSNGKGKKLKSLKELPEDEMDGDMIKGGFSELEENSDAEVEQEEVDTLTNSTKKHRRRKKSKQKKDAAGDMTSVIPEPEEAPDAEEMSVSPTNASEIGASVKYVPPHLRSHAGKESEEHTRVRRRVRGLLNKLSESNVELVTGEMISIFQSVSRSVSIQIISDEVLAACSSGPRGNERYASVFAAFVAGMACSVGMDFGAKLMASLAKSFQNEYLKEDNISLRNITLLLSYLYIFGVCSSDLIYDFLIMLSERLTEIDVSTILTVLQCCGMKIRGEDPTSMKSFIQSVQSRVNKLKTSSEEAQGEINGKRMEFMLETICDIKNNKKRPKEENPEHTRIKKWLQKLRVEDIFLIGVKWSKLLDPDKKGQWWLTGDMVGKTDDVEEVANTIDKEVLEAQKLLQLAASQRMTTDARKAIFCVIMSGEDYIDAFEKLLRLDLPGKQDREIMRVLLECCLQEEVFNKYYTILASKLCEHDKNQKFTLQFCLWDQFKELESMRLLRSMHLAKFVAEMIASFTLSLAVLKSVDFNDVGQLTPKKIMHFRMMFEALFDFPDKIVWNAFTRVSVAPDLEALRDGIGFFIREYVVKTNRVTASKFKVAKRALDNTEGVLM